MKTTHSFCQPLLFLNLRSRYPLSWFWSNSNPVQHYTVLNNIWCCIISWMSCYGSVSIRWWMYCFRVVWPSTCASVYTSQKLINCLAEFYQIYNSGARFTKYLTTHIRLSYDNAEVTIDWRRTSNLQNILWLSYDKLAIKVLKILR